MFGRGKPKEIAYLFFVLTGPYITNPPKSRPPYARPAQTHAQTQVPILSIVQAVYMRTRRLYCVYMRVHAHTQTFIYGLHCIVQYIHIRTHSLIYFNLCVYTYPYTLYSMIHVQTSYCVHTHMLYTQDNQHEFSF